MGGEVSYILIIIFTTYGLANRSGISVSEMRTKASCEAAIKAVKDKKIWNIKSVECVEVKP